MGPEKFNEKYEGQNLDDQVRFVGLPSSIVEPIKDIEKIFKNLIFDQDISKKNAKSGVKIELMQNKELSKTLAYLLELKVKLSIAVENYYKKEAKAGRADQAIQTLKHIHAEIILPLALDQFRNSRNYMSGTIGLLDSPDNIKILLEYTTLSSKLDKTINEIGDILLNSLIEQNKKPKISEEESLMKKIIELEKQFKNLDPRLIRMVLVKNKKPEEKLKKLSELIDKYPYLKEKSLEWSKDLVSVIEKDPTLILDLEKKEGREIDFKKELQDFLKLADIPWYFLLVESSTIYSMDMEFRLKEIDLEIKKLEKNEEFKTIDKRIIKSAVFGYYLNMTDVIPELSLRNLKNSPELYLLEEANLIKKDL